MRGTNDVDRLQQFLCKNHDKFTVKVLPNGITVVIHGYNTVDSQDDLHVGCESLSEATGLIRGFVLRQGKDNW